MRNAFFLAVLCLTIVPCAGFSADPPFPEKAPIIHELPDLVIGDTGDISGAGPAALRLYRYLNALNVFDSNVIVWLNGYPLDKRHLYLYRNAATDPIVVRASKPAAFVNSLSNAEYTALVGSGTPPGAGTNIIDAATTFGYLSLMNTDITTHTPATAYGANPDYLTSYGVQTSLIPSGKYGKTDLILVANETDVTTAILQSTRAFTVFTIANNDDQTTGIVPPPVGWEFPGGDPQGWYCRTNMGDPMFGAATTSFETTFGGIGWDATGPSGGTLGLNYGTWYLSDDESHAKFLIPGNGMSGMVYRVRVGLRSDTSLRYETCSWRLVAISYQTVCWQGIQVATDSAGPEEDAPISSDGVMETQLHFAVPYDLCEMSDTGVMATTDWVGAGDAMAPADGRSYCLTFDGIDYSDRGHLWMDYCYIDSYPRPADKTTPDLSWGVGGTTPMNDATNGWFFPTTNPYRDIALLATSATKDANSVTMTMGAMPTGLDIGKARWQQAHQDVVHMTNKYTETAHELLRYKVTYHSGIPDTAPNVRFQSRSATGVDDTVYYSKFGAFGTRLVLDNTGSVTQPGVPKAQSGGGSIVDLYRYIMRTSSGRFLHFYWDAYGVPAGSTEIAHNWADQTGSITVTSIVLNGNLSNP